jgi:xylulokinase
MELILGIDIGTTNCKAILFTLAGQLVASGSAPTPTYHPRPEWSEHDPEQLWQTVAATIRQSLRGQNPALVRGISVTSVGESGTLVDANGRALCPMIAWYDARTAPELRRWQATIDQRRVTAITGLQARPIATLFKLQWLREHAADAYQTATRWLLTADYIAFRLCAAQATDYSLASRTLLFNLHTRQWSHELIEAAGLRHDLLPELLPAGQHIGAVTAIAAAETGLAIGTPIGLGGHDHIVGAFAAGIVRSGECLDSLGTAEVAFLPLDTPPSEDVIERTGLTFGVHVARNRTFMMDGLLSGGASINWVRDLLTPGEPGFERLEHMAASAPSGARGAVFLPYITAGERGAFAGLTIATGPNELARAVYEGLALGWRRLLERAEQLLEFRVHTIRVIGGGAQSDLWLQIKVNAVGRPLRLLSLTEGVALGAAMLGGIAAGAYRDEDEALRQVQLDEQNLEPNPQQAAIYEQIYHERFVDLMPALAKIHASIRDDAP